MAGEGDTIRCPRCGHEGFYTRYTYTRVTGVYDGRGEFIEESFDGAARRGGGVAYCIECDKRMGKVSELLERRGV